MRLLLVLMALSLASACSVIEVAQKIPYDCTSSIVDERVNGPEDVVYDWQRGKLYASAYRGKPGVFVANVTDGDNLRFSQLRTGVNTHGMSLHDNVIYAIDHVRVNGGSTGDIVEERILAGDDDRVITIRGCPDQNDLVVLSDESVVASCNPSRLAALFGKSKHLLGTIDGDVVTYAEDPISSGMLANGVAATPRGNFVVSYSISGKVKGVSSDGYELWQMRIGGGPDNFSWDHSQAFLYLTTHESLRKFRKVQEGAESPSRFFRFDLGDESAPPPEPVELILDGVKPNAPSVVTPISEDRLVVGSVAGDSVYVCRPRVALR